MKSDIRHVRPLSVVEFQFQRADGPEMAVDDFRRDVFELVRPPAGLRSLSTIAARMPSMKSWPAMHASAIR